MVNQLRRSTPEAQGIASSAILAFIDAAERDIDALHSLMVLRHGAVVAEGWWSPYAPARPHMLFSLSKSFTSTAIGLAVAEGRLSVEDTVLSFFPEDAPETVSEHLAAMRVKHLLSMNTGHAEDTTGHLRESEDGNWVKAFLALPVEHEPGTHFLYNTGASYVLSAIVQRLTGVTLLEYLQPRLFEPLGIEGAKWGTCPRGINFGGFGLDVKTGDIARFGQLYLQKGMWNGQRILLESWVAEASAFHSDNAPADNPEWEQGYGYQFWLCRHNAYRGDGAFGQYCIVMPEQDAVIAITSGVPNMQAVLDLIWEHLLPAMGSDALPEDSAMQAKLAQKLVSLRLAPQAGAPSSTTADCVSGQRYDFEANDQQIDAITVEFALDQDRVTFHSPAGEYAIDCGHGAWIEGVAPFGDGTLAPVAASGGWADEETYVIKLCYVETPFRPTMTLRFEEDRVTYIFKSNVAFGPTERPVLVGKAL